MSEREGYGFSLKDKEAVRKRSNGNCEFVDCIRPNTGKVNHLTGCFEGKLRGVPQSIIRDPNLNATMECRLHEAMHDVQEKRNIETIIYERRNNTIYKRSSGQRVAKKRRR